MDETTYRMWTVTEVYRKLSDPKYQDHHALNKLITDKEKEARELKIAKRMEEPVSPNETFPDTHTVQARNTGLKNYNFEQFGEFKRLYDQQMEEDRQKQHELKRMFKYIHENPKKGLPLKRQLLHGEDADNVDISHLVDPNVDISNYTPPKSRRARRQIVRTRTSRDLTNYDSWR